jgi:hypothetical protein
LNHLCFEISQAQDVIISCFGESYLLFVHWQTESYHFSFCRIVIVVTWS